MWSCSGDKYHIDINDQELELDWVRLDQELFGHSDLEMPAKCIYLQERVGGFFKLYVEDLLRLAPIDSPQLPAMLIGFTNDPDWRNAQNQVDTVLGQLALERLQMTDAFKRLRVLYPDAVVPQVVLFNAGFNYGVVPLDTVLGVGVEWFIGSDKEVIKYLAPENFPQYLKDRMNPEMLVPSAIKGWLLAHYASDVSGQDVLEHLIARGKVLVLLEALIPESAEHDQLAFTKEQLLWCEENAFEMWQELIRSEMLYSKKAEDIGRFMNDGPFTNGFPRESPGHIGEFIGKRIVQSYWEANPDLDLLDVLNEPDAQSFLRTYKPR